MDVVKIGSLNINGTRDRSKWPLLKEFERNSSCVSTRNTYSSNEENKTDWGMWWEGDHVMASTFVQGWQYYFHPDIKFLKVEISFWVNKCLCSCNR